MDQKVAAQSARKEDLTNSSFGIKIKDNPTQCPSCHDRVKTREFESAKVCQRCLSRHHEECWFGRCSSCGHQRFIGEQSQKSKLKIANKEHSSVIDLEQKFDEQEQGRYRKNYRLLGSWYAIVTACFFLSIPLFEPTEFTETPTIGELVINLFCFLFLILTFFMTGANYQDYKARKKLGLTTSMPSMLVNCIGLFLLGLPIHYYFWRWGRRPITPIEFKQALNQQLNRKTEES